MKGDLVLQLVPEPLPALSTDSQDLDLTLDDITTPEEITPRSEEMGQEAPVLGKELEEVVHMVDLGSILTY